MKLENLGRSLKKNGTVLERKKWDGPWMKKRGTVLGGKKETVLEGKKWNGPEKKKNIKK